MSAHLTLPVNWILQKVARAIPKALLIMVVLSTMLAGTPAKAVLLNFQDIPIPGGTDSAPFFTYTNSGFTLTAINPPTGFLSGFQAHGPNSIFFAGAIGVTAFPPASGPDNVINLIQDNGDPFSLLSIDLARNFAFDPAPSVTFTGTRSGGDIVTETFTVTIPVGTSAFQSFDFAGFTDLESVTWEQPVLAAGLHQFTNIELVAAPAAVPEPSIWLLVATGLVILAAFGLRRQRRNLWL